MLKSKILVVGGATGTGKSQLALTLAKKLNGEIICADSVGVYKGLHVGSCNLSSEETTGIPHYLNNEIEPTISFSAGDFVKQSKLLMKDILSRGKVPIIVGGSTFYMKSLLEGLPPVGTCLKVRKRISEKLSTMSFDEAFVHLYEQDPVYAKSAVGNIRRVSRALEIIELTGKTPTELAEIYVNNEQEYDYRSIYLMDPDRLRVARTLDKRCEQIIEDGLLEEVLSLRRTYDLALPGEQVIPFGDLTVEKNGAEAEAANKSSKKGENRNNNNNSNSITNTTTNSNNYNDNNIIESNKNDNNNNNNNSDKARNKPVLNSMIVQAVGYRQGITYINDHLHEYLQKDGYITHLDTKNFSQFVKLYQNAMRRFSTSQHRFYQSRPDFYRIDNHINDKKVPSHDLIHKILQFYEIEDDNVKASVIEESQNRPYYTNRKDYLPILQLYNKKESIARKLQKIFLFEKKQKAV